MTTTWVLVAESSRARLLESDGPRAPLRELEDFSHPEGRQHEQDITSDLPGRTFDRGGEGRHAMSEPVSPKEHEAEAFARSLAAHLEKGRVDGRFAELMVAAPPHFLGLLREQMSEDTRRQVSRELDKNLVQLSPDEIREHISGAS